MIIIDPKYHKLARGEFQRRCCRGEHLASLADLQGKARRSKAQYQQSLTALLERCRSEGATVVHGYALGGQPRRWKAFTMALADTTATAELGRRGFDIFRLAGSDTVRSLVGADAG